MQVAILSANAQAGDAIGNQVAEKVAFFRERNARVRVFLDSARRLHPDLKSYSQAVSAEPSGAAWEFVATADLLIVEFGQSYRLLEWLPLIAGGKPKILFDYHGITPRSFCKTQQDDAVEKGSRERGLVWFADLAVTHSQFTSAELCEPTGYPAERVWQLGHPVDMARLGPGLPGRDLRGHLKLREATLLLFVGRLAANKRVSLLVDVLPLLDDLTPAVHLAIAGDVSDVYREQMDTCLTRAHELGVVDRVHFLGHVPANELLDAYRSADLFIMPSLHEGFCIPVVEAMACGLPVLAARSSALPETLGNAGLSFTPDNRDDLAGQIRRVLASGQSTVSAKNRSPGRVAIVCFRYGADIIGGAETSLRRIARSLRSAGRDVEIFTTCTTEESDWHNQRPEGTTLCDGIPVHRFAIDAHDRQAHHQSVRAILQSFDPPSDEEERNYLRHSLHSTRLLDALKERQHEFDAIIVGPYLFGLTLDVATAFPEQTLLLPCFHDEPFVRLKVWQSAYRGVGGILYHSCEEQILAEVELGLNHPGNAYLGTFLETLPPADGCRGRTMVRTAGPYVVYCGRYSREKNLPLLLEYQRTYANKHPGQFTFVFMGRGEVAIPREPWAVDLGAVADDLKRDVMAGARALVQLSRFESLSLVALEAWALGVPVLADSKCPVLAGHVRRCAGGQLVGSYEEFESALDLLRTSPEQGRAWGRAGQEYVASQFGSGESFTARLMSAIEDLGVPLIDRMRQRGQGRASQWERGRWQTEFGRLVEDVLDSPPRPKRERVEIRPRVSDRAVRLGTERVLVPVRVANGGSHPLIPHGPGRCTIRATVRDEAGQLCDVPPLETPLATLVLPGQEITAAVAVGVPRSDGDYHVQFEPHFPQRVAEMKSENTSPGIQSSSAGLRLQVGTGERYRGAGCCHEILDEAHRALANAECQRELPNDYVDVTEGPFAGLKRQVKKKLLNNFKLAYVDVLARRQSEFNRHILEAVQEIAECCTLLDQAWTTGDRPGEKKDSEKPEFLAAAIESAVEAGKADELAVLFHDMRARLTENEIRLAELARRICQLEGSAPKPATISV